jgi:hypothetical protein
MCEKGKRVSNNSKRHKHQGERKRERKRELGDRKPREERRGKLVSLDPFSLFVFGGARNVEEISLPSRRRNTPRERATRSKSTHLRAEILSERDANDFTREFVSPNSVVHSNTNAQVLDLSQKGGKRGLKNVKAGLEFQSRARANTHDANDKNKFSFTYLLASIDVRV